MHVYAFVYMYAVLFISNYILFGFVIAVSVWGRLVGSVSFTSLEPRFARKLGSCDRCDLDHERMMAKPDSNWKDLIVVVRERAFECPTCWSESKYVHVSCSWHGRTKIWSIHAILVNDTIPSTFWSEHHLQIIVEQQNYLQLEDLSWNSFDGEDFQQMGKQLMQTKPGCLGTIAAKFHRPIHAVSCFLRCLCQSKGI